MTLQWSFGFGTWSGVWAWKWVMMSDLQTGYWTSLIQAGSTPQLVFNCSCHTGQSTRSTSTPLWVRSVLGYEQDQHNLGRWFYCCGWWVYTPSMFYVCSGLSFQLVPTIKPPQKALKDSSLQPSEPSRRASLAAEEQLTCLELLPKVWAPRGLSSDEHRVTRKDI